MSLRGVTDRIVSYLSVVRRVPPTTVSRFLRASLISRVGSAGSVRNIHDAEGRVLATFSIPRSGRSFCHLNDVIGGCVGVVRGRCVPLAADRSVHRLFSSFLTSRVGQSSPGGLPSKGVFHGSHISVISPTRGAVRRKICPRSTVVRVVSTTLSILGSGAVPCLVHITVFRCFFNCVRPFCSKGNQVTQFVASCLLTLRLRPTVTLRISVLVGGCHGECCSLFSRASTSVGHKSLAPFVVKALRFVRRTALFARRALGRGCRACRGTGRGLARAPSLTAGGGAATTVYSVLLRTTVFSSVNISMGRVVRALGVSRGAICGRLGGVPGRCL